MPPLMTLPQKRPQRLQMIEQALQEKAPRRYRELRDGGNLAPTVKECEREMMESYLTAEDALRDQWYREPGRDHLEHLQSFETRTRELWEQTLAEFLEFVDPEGETTE